MAQYPPNFSSEKEYNSYLNCLSNLKAGDQVFCRSQYETIEGIFLGKEPAAMMFGDNYIGWNILLFSTVLSGGFYTPSVREKIYLTDAKKYNSKIRISKAETRWLFAISNRVVKIIKFNNNGEKEKKEKEKVDKKSLCSLRENAFFSRAYEAQIILKKRRQKQTTII